MGFSARGSVELAASSRCNVNSRRIARRSSVMNAKGQSRVGGLVSSASSVTSSGLSAMRCTPPTSTGSGSGSMMRASRRRVVVAAAAECSMQFIKGVEEPTVPEVKLTRSRDGAQGTATLYFEKPAVFENTGEMGEITGLYMIDNEGEMSTVDVVAKFKNGQPAGIEAKYIMKSSSQWDRFMRFMQRYAEDNNLGFNKS